MTRGRFAGQIVVVTGASSGIGSATALRFAQEGARVVAVADRAAELADTVAELQRRYDVTAITCHVGDADAVRHLADQVRALGGARVLVNNAGVVEEHEFSEVPRESWERVLRVNLTGAFLCSQAFVSQLAGGGAIVSTASVNGLFAERRVASYNAAKGGLIMLTRSMALDLAARGIRVNAVAPGIIRTPLTAAWLDEGLSAAFERRIPAGRIGDPEEVASCIAFLASDDASYVNGEILVCDGGQTASIDVA